MVNSLFPGMAPPVERGVLGAAGRIARLGGAAGGGAFVTASGCAPGSVRRDEHFEYTCKPDGTWCTPYCYSPWHDTLLREGERVTFDQSACLLCHRVDNNRLALIYEDISYETLDRSEHPACG